MKLIKVLIVLFVLLVLEACAKTEPTKLTNITGLIPDLEFELTDENNKQVTAKDYPGSVA